MCSWKQKLQHKLIGNSGLHKMGESALLMLKSFDLAWSNKRLFNSQWFFRNPSYFHPPYEAVNTATDIPTAEHFRDLGTSVQVSTTQAKSSFFSCWSYSAWHLELLLNSFICSSQRKTVITCRSEEKLQNEKKSTVLGPRCCSSQVNYVSHARPVSATSV